MNIISNNDYQIKKPSFAVRIEKKTVLIYDLRVVMNDEPRYFIIKVPPPKRDAFLTVVASEAGFRLEGFGEILFRGWDEPPDDLKEQLKQEYGMYQDAQEGGPA